MSNAKSNEEDFAKPLPARYAAAKRRNTELSTACRAALALLEKMKEDGGVRLPYPGYEEALEALRAALVGVVT